MTPEVRLTISSDALKWLKVVQLQVIFGNESLYAKVSVQEEYLYKYGTTTAEEDILYKLIQEICHQAPWLNKLWLMEEINKFMPSFNQGNSVWAKSTDHGWSELGHLKESLKPADFTDIYISPKDELPKFAAGGLTFNGNVEANTITSGILSPWQEDAPSVWLKRASKLPGMDVKVKYPCLCDLDTTPDLMTAIMHLNDKHGPGNLEEMWTTERVCEWLDELHDTGVVNLEIEIPDKEIK